MARPLLNLTRLSGWNGQEQVPLEVLLLGPDPAEPSFGYVARLTIDQDDRAIDVGLDALLRALTPAVRPPADASRLGSAQDETS